MVSGLNRLTGTQILLVGIVPDIRDILITILELEGAEVIVLQMAYEVIEYINKSSPDALVCDIILPDFSGYNLIQIVKNQCLEIGSILPSIAISSTGLPIDQRQIRNAGFDAVFDRIDEPTQLIELLYALLAKG